MVLRLKARESRSSPGLPSTYDLRANGLRPNRARFSNTLFLRERPLAAGWSSPVARQAHNLKVVGSNPTPAPKS